MQRASELVGKPIVTADSGERVGRAVDLLVDAGAERVVGVVVGGGVLGGERVLPYDGVHVLGVDAVVARSRDATVDAHAWHRDAADTMRSSSLKGKRVVTSDGRQLGSVDDLYVDERTGAVAGLDIARRRLGGLLTRHRMLSRSGVTIGRDVVVVPSDAAERLEKAPKRAPRTAAGG